MVVLDVTIVVVPLPFEADVDVNSLSKSRSRRISFPAAERSPCNESSRSRRRLISR